MARALQKRKTDTFEKMLTIGESMIVEQGMDQLRVDELVKKAGVAKGTFFAHFKDKDGFLSIIVGNELTRILDQLATTEAPETVKSLCQTLTPLIDYIAQDRIVLDLVLRYSGATGPDIQGDVANSFPRQNEIMARWIESLQEKGLVRSDGDALLFAEGVQAFQAHIIAVSFCVDHENDNSLVQQLEEFVVPWLSKPRLA